MNMNTKNNNASFIIRDAVEADLEICLSIDRAYSTDQVWQMEVQDDNKGRIGVSFRTVRLPRPMRVVYPPDRALLHACDCLLIAEANDIVQGYLGMRADLAYGNGWVLDVTVAPPWRRHGIGGALLKAAHVWAREHELSRITIETQTKNFPGICFCQKYGLTFSGFNDKHYPNQDIALFFSQRVR